MLRVIIIVILIVVCSVEYYTIYSTVDNTATIIERYTYVVIKQVLDQI